MSIPSHKKETLKTFSTKIPSKRRYVIVPQTTKNKIKKTILTSQKPLTTKTHITSPPSEDACIPTTTTQELKIFQNPATSLTTKQLLFDFETIISPNRNIFLSTSFKT